MSFGNHSADATLFQQMPGNKTCRTSPDNEHGGIILFHDKKSHNLYTDFQSKIVESHETVDESCEFHGPAEFKGWLGIFS